MVPKVVISSPIANPLLLLTNRLEEGYDLWYNAAPGLGNPFGFLIALKGS
jgi:hypothetical protein